MRRVDGKVDAAGQGDAAPTATSKKVSLRKLLDAADKSAAPDTALMNASALIHQSITVPSGKATRGFITDETIDRLRSECPGWDLYTLHQDFEQ